MAKLKGGQPKETAKEKKQRRKEFEAMQKQVKTIVVPALIVVAVFIAFYIYMKTRPAVYNTD